MVEQPPPAGIVAPMPLFVAYFRFKQGAGVMDGLVAFERRKTFKHPARAKVLGEYWVNAGPNDPQVVVIWEGEDDGPGDYYEAAWGDLFDLSIAPATLPLSELPPGFESMAKDGPPAGG